MASFNAESNQKDYEEIESKTNNNENHQNWVIKTKREDEKNSRSSLEVITSDLEEAQQNDLSSKTQNVASVEIRRLEQINGRSTRLVFKGIWDLPPVKEIMNLNPDIVSVVKAKNRAPSCFCIFADAKKKIEAEHKLDGARFRRGNIVVEKHRKMVPVDTDDLDGTREPLTLAVHGIARDVTNHDLKKVFPAAEKISIAHRGGSAFLKYPDYSSAGKAFVEAEDISVRGCRVQVLFSHLIDKTRRKTNGSLKKDSSAVSSQPSSQSEKDSVKMDMKSLLLILDGAGLKMDKLQKDYIRGGCEPGSGPDIRTAWMDHLKTNSRNKLSRSSRMDIVDNVWNFFDKDEYTQQRLKLEMEYSDKNKDGGMTQEIVEKPYRCMLKAVDEEIEKRNCRETERSWEYGPSPGRKRYRDWDYPSSPERNRRKRRETSSSSSPQRKETYLEDIPGKVYSGRENRDNTSSDSSPRRSDTRTSSLKHCKRKIEYNSSSPSPPPEANKIRRDASEKQKGYSEVTLTSKSEVNENKLQGIKGDKPEQHMSSKTVILKKLSDKSQTVILKKQSDKSQDSEVRKFPDESYTSKIKSLKTSDKDSSFQRILEVKEGFTRMALVMGWRLGYNCDRDQGKCKAMASALVAVWTNYGFSYSELKDMYADEKQRDPDDGSEDVSFLELRRLLHKRLRKKVEDGHAMPKKFTFSMLIDLTMFYFEKAT